MATARTSREPGPSVHVAPTAEQRKLYRLAHEQVQHNMALLCPGMSHREFVERSWDIPEPYRHNRYCCVVHGVGLADEYPALAHKGTGWAGSGYDGQFEENMVLCVESYIGEQGGAEGIKLEQQVVITPGGCEALSRYPWQTDWL